MADILCPHCGMPNPDDQNICTFCRQPLHTAQENESIRPGDMPTKKATAELEPILPQWLRDARARAKEDATEDHADQSVKEPEKPAPQEAAPQDFLAGLAAAAKEDGEEDVPDWMHGLAPAKLATPAPKSETPNVEKSFTHREEISWEEETPPAPRSTTPPPTGPLGAVQSEDGIPYWLKTLEEESADEKSESKETPPAPARPQSNVSPFQTGTFRPDTGELINWLDTVAPKINDAAPNTDSPAAEPIPDWISKLDSDSGESEPAAPANADFNFDWLKEEASKPFAPFQASKADDELSGDAVQEESAGLPDWMAKLEENAQEIPVAPIAPIETEAPKDEPTAVPDWLTAMANESSAADATPAGDLPDWMKALPEVPAAANVETPPAPADLPDWMNTFADSSAPATPPPASTEAGSALPDLFPPATEAPAPSANEAPSFDWIQPASEPRPQPEMPSAPRSVPPFVAGDEAVEASEADELFSVNLPDWLSSIAPTESKPTKKTSQPEPATGGESIAPAELPTWVQAMRPVESALPGASATDEPVSQPAESEGALAGLHGVLPSADMAMSGKPRIYSIRLDPTADQQQHAALLEQMLEAETQPKPMRSDSVLLRSQRVLRWIVTAVLVGLIGFVLFTGLRVLPLPTLLTPESATIVNILDGLPNDAPVLMVFDYEPALAGEMEAAGVSFVDRMTALHHPQYTVLSTNPNGAALATRLLSRSVVQSDRVTNLGYLPGESAGVLSFALNPQNAKRYQADGAPAQNVNVFSDYALVVLFTDRADSARAWVEQTASQRNGRPFVVVSSAQAAPMIQPYLLSGQVNAMISGLRGGAAFEGASQQPGPASGYWDAYNLSLLAAVVMIFLGAAWNLVLGMRARRQEQMDA